MHTALGDHFAVKMRQLLDQPEILQRDRATRTRGERVLVISDGRAGGGGEFALGHRELQESVGINKTRTCRGKRSARAGEVREHVQNDAASVAISRGELCDLAGDQRHGFLLCFCGGSKLIHGSQNTKRYRF
jgi:hypothetical protein